jgi:hypothetical protein
VLVTTHAPFVQAKAAAVRREGRVEAGDAAMPEPTWCWSDGWPRTTTRPPPRSEPSTEDDRTALYHLADPAVSH